MADLTPEQIARLEAGIEEDAAAIEEDVDELQEQLAVHSIVTVEQYHHLATEVKTCLEKLDRLLTMCQALPQDQSSAENPTLQRVAESVAVIQEQMRDLRLSMDTRANLQTIPSPSATNPEEVASPEAETAPPPVATRPPRKRRML